MFINIYYIELLMFMFSLAQGLRASANFSTFYYKVCKELYTDFPETCYTLKTDKAAENHVQHETAQWLMYIEIISFIPSLLSAMFFGSFGDKYNRKVPTMVAITSMVLHIFLYTFFVSLPVFPMWVMVAEAGFVALGGTKTVFVSAQFAEAACQTKDKSQLTQRFVVLSACISCAIFVAGNVSPLLLTNFSLVWTMIIGEMVMAAAFFTAFALHSPKIDAEDQPKLRTRCTSGEYPCELTLVDLHGKTLAPSKRFSVKPAQQSKAEREDLIKRMIALYRSAWHTVTKPREYRGRMRLLLLCVVGLIYACSDAGLDTVITLYVYHEPLSWTPTVFSRWMATMSIVQMVGGIFGAHILKRLNCSDYTVLLIGLTSAMLKMICTSLANSTWTMFLALAFGGLSGVGVPSLRSIVAQLGESDESSELTSVLSIVIGWAPLISSLIFNNIYANTLIIWHGFTFVVVGIFLLVCFTIVIISSCMRDES